VRMSPPESDHSELVDDGWHKREGGALMPVELSVALVSI